MFQIMTASMTAGKARIMSQILTVAASSAPSWSFSSKFWDSLTALQWAAVISALVLTIGAVIEYSKQLKLLVLLLGKWVSRSLTVVERCVLRKLLIHSLGPILVTLGIAGDFVFGGRAFILEDRQEEQARKTMGSVRDMANEADQKAKDAISDSSTALSQAKDALGKAGKAQESLGKTEKEANGAEMAASNALRIAREARQEADSFEKEIASAKEAVAKTEEKLADRTLTDKQVKFIASKLKQYAGQEYNVTAYWDSKESVGIANRIHQALQFANWKIVDTDKWRGLMGGVIGVFVAYHPEADERTQQAAKALVTALSLEGIEAEPQIENAKSNPKHNKISVTIGSKR
jgi:hypothetical protein